jgi:hypothetical protein
MFSDKRYIAIKQTSEKKLLIELLIRTYERMLCGLLTHRRIATSEFLLKIDCYPRDGSACCPVAFCPA